MGEVDALTRVLDATAKQGEDPEIDGFRRRCSEARQALQAFSALDEPNLVYWAELRGRGVFLRAAPVDIAQQLRAALFERE